MTALKDPFAVVHKKDIKNKNDQVVAQVDYVGWSQVADRLDEAEPGWSFAVMQLGDDWCLGQLRLKDGRTFDNVGYAENADADWKKEALKDAVSDALKRCAALAGAARYLYDKDTRPQAPQRPQTAAAPRSAPDEPPWPVDAVPAAQEVFAGMLDESKCPDHGYDWKTNSRGYFCSGKTDGKWCERKPSKAWAASQELAPA